MNEKISEISVYKHPKSSELTNAAEVFNRIVTAIIIFADVLGIIIALFASISLSKIDYSSFDIPVNFFGYTIEVSNNAFLASPFMVFVYIVIIFAIITLIMIGIDVAVCTLIATRIEMLDNTYRTAKLTEFLAQELYKKNDTI